MTAGTFTAIQSIQPGDLAPALALNNANVPMVNHRRIAELAALVRQAALAEAVADDQGIAGLVIVLAPGARYESPNYRWFEARMRNFLYVDRIAVADRCQGRRLGSALYRRVFNAAGRRPVVCEVNLSPPNPGSLAFHLRLGFRPIGRAFHAVQGKGVIFLRRTAADADASREPRTAARVGHAASARR
jgi:predicted GNAT superfamily acetyltransferase